MPSHRPFYIYEVLLFVTFCGCDRNDVTPANTAAQPNVEAGPDGITARDGAIEVNAGGAHASPRSNDASVNVGAAAGTWSVATEQGAVSVRGGDSTLEVNEAPRPAPEARASSVEVEAGKRGAHVEVDQGGDRVEVRRRSSKLEVNTGKTKVEVGGVGGSRIDGLQP